MIFVWIGGYFMVCNFVLWYAWLQSVDKYATIERTQRVSVLCTVCCVCSFTVHFAFTGGEKEIERILYATRLNHSVLLKTGGNTEILKNHIQ